MKNSIQIKQSREGLSYVASVNERSVASGHLDEMLKRARKFARTRGGLIVVISRGNQVTEAFEWVPANEFDPDATGFVELPVDPKGVRI